MTGFLGSFSNQLDAKGRLSLPAAFRRAETGDVFVLVHTQPDALTLYPESEWELVAGRLREMLREDASSRTYVLYVTANACRVELDGQGRILIPQRLSEAVGLSDKALVVGAIDRIEVWEPSRFAAAVETARGRFDHWSAQVFR